jgi:hypothetical protein
MLGEVAVSVVLLESDGSRDVNTENWTPAQIEAVKSRVVEGLEWWREALRRQQSVHTLDFKIDFTYADQPVPTGYEPISRTSEEVSLWIEDFFVHTGVPAGASFSDRIRHYNHSLRQQHATHWAFTIIVVNASNDSDQRFAAGSSNSQSFSYAGGRFFVTTSERPASSYAHETGHMFWAMDEYAGSKSYFEHRGYYSTQNINGYDDNPQPALREASIMDSHTFAYSQYAISTSAREMIGWRDSDGDGIFDVLDVPHRLVGQGAYQTHTGRYQFNGFAEVQTLANRNASGSGHPITINKIDEVQLRFDPTSAWQTVAATEGYLVPVNLDVSVPPGAFHIEIRVMDTSSGVASSEFRDSWTLANSPWQNWRQPLDVSDDSLITPLDALLIINQLNAGGSRQLALSDGPLSFIDCNGDRFLSPLDALLVINELNRQTATPRAASRTQLLATDQVMSAEAWTMTSRRSVDAVLEVESESPWVTPSTPDPRHRAQNLWVDIVHSPEPADYEPPPHAQRRSADSAEPIGIGETPLRADGST